MTHNSKCCLNSQCLWGLYMGVGVISLSIWDTPPPTKMGLSSLLLYRTLPTRGMSKYNTSFGVTSADWELAMGVEAKYSNATLSLNTKQADRGTDFTLQAIGRCHVLGHGQGRRAGTVRVCVCNAVRAARHSWEVGAPERLGALETTKKCDSSSFASYAFSATISTTIWVH
jgi:hypothetical protein